MYSLPYGTSYLEIPDLWGGQATVLTPGPFPDSVPEEVVARALDNPVGKKRIDEMCHPGSSVAVVVPDMTRRASVSKYLPVLLGKLNKAGIHPQNVSIVIALGIHRAMSGKEIRDHLGSGVLQDHTVVNHDADNEEQNVLLGETDAGIPVQVNRLVADADSVILTGGITCHYFAGYGGGRKSFLPGVASRKACEAHHRMVVSWRRGELSGELGAGVLEDNPVHRQMMQACGFVPPIFTLNVVTEPGGRIIAASAGDLEAAHYDACRKYDHWYRRELPQRSKLVIAGAGGRPRDVNFVQAHKGLYTAHQAVIKGGVVIMAAECPEGPGHVDLLRWFDRCDSTERWLEELQNRYQINGQTAFSTWLRVTSVPTVFVSRMKRSEVEKMGMIPAEDMNEALEAARRITGELPVPLIIPDAGDMLIVSKGDR